MGCGQYRKSHNPHEFSSNASWARANGAGCGLTEAATKVPFFPSGGDDFYRHLYGEMVGCGPDPRAMQRVSPRPNERGCSATIRPS